MRTPYRKKKDTKRSTICPDGGIGMILVKRLRPDNPEYRGTEEILVFMVEECSLGERCVVQCFWLFSRCFCCISVEFF